MISVMGAISIIGYNYLLSALSSLISHLCSFLIPHSSFLIPLFSLLKPTHLSLSPLSNYLVFRLTGRIDGEIGGDNEG